jgi:hypothetical protein
MLEDEEVSGNTILFLRPECIALHPFHPSTASMTEQTKEITSQWKERRIVQNVSATDGRTGRGILSYLGPKHCHAYCHAYN